MPKNKTFQPGDKVRVKKGGVSYYGADKSALVGVVRTDTYAAPYGYVSVDLTEPTDTRQRWIKPDYLDALEPDLKVGDRVEVVDYPGNYYNGLVLTVTEVDVKPWSDGRRVFGGDADSSWASMRFPLSNVRLIEPEPEPEPTPLEQIAKVLDRWYDGNTSDWAVRRIAKIVKEAGL